MAYCNKCGNFYIISTYNDKLCLVCYLNSEQRNDSWNTKGFVKKEGDANIGERYIPKVHREELLFEHNIKIQWKYHNKGLKAGKL